MLGAVRNLLRPDPWGAFEIQAWRDLAHVSGRLGTETDVKEGRAVFYLAGGEEPATPYDMRLPVCAIHRDETGESLPVVIVQAERSGDRVLVGFRYPSGGNGIATLDEMELFDPGDPTRTPRGFEVEGEITRVDRK